MKTNSRAFVWRMAGCFLGVAVWLGLTAAAPGEKKTAPAKPATVKPAPAKPAAAASEKGPRETSFDDIKLDLAKDQPFDRKILTPEVEALHKKKIRIRGYILPTFQQSGLTTFVLVRDNMECCFGPGAALYDCILVSMKAGATADFSTRPVVVEGTFRIEDFLDIDGKKQLAIYQMEGEKVE